MKLATFTVTTVGRLHVLDIACGEQLAITCHCLPYVVITKLPNIAQYHMIHVIYRTLNTYSVIINCVVGCYKFADLPFVAIWTV